MDEGNRARIGGCGGGRGHVERNDRRPAEVAPERDLRVHDMSSVVNDACKLTVKIMNNADIVWVLLSLLLLLRARLSSYAAFFGFVLVGSRALQP